jgi:hypothetical protein
MVPNLRRGRHFDRGITYVLHDKQDRTKPRAGARLIVMENVTSIETAGIEMRAFASLSPRCKRPMAHYTASLAPGERLDDDKWRLVIDRLNRKVFGLDASHQYVGVVHGVLSTRAELLAHRHSRRFPDATRPHHGCEHIHLIINLISTVTGRTTDDHWDANINLRLQAECRELERDLGLKQLRAYIPKEEIDPDGPPRLRDLGKPSTGQLANEMRTGMRPLIDDQDIIAPALEQSGWAATIKALADIGIMFKPATDKNGATKGLSLVDAHDTKRSAKLSQFIANGMKMLEERLGESFDNYVARASAMPTPARMPDRDPERTALLRQFEAAKRAHEQRDDTWARERRDLGTKHARQTSEQKAALKNDAPSAEDETRIQLLLTRMTAAERKRIEHLRRLYRQARARQQRVALAAAQKAEKAALTARKPRRQPTWASWLGQQTAHGSEAAARVLERLTRRLAQRGLVEAVADVAAPSVERSITKMQPDQKAPRTPPTRSPQPPAPAPHQPALSEQQRQAYDRRNRGWARERDPSSSD